MNYGKTAYLKILDIEKAINFNNKNSNKNIYFEITKPNINENFNFLTPYTTTLNDFIPTKNEDVFFQIKVNLTPTILSDINFEILINDNIIHSETKSISSNQTEILLMKTYTPLSDDKLSLKLKISTNSENSFVIVNDISAIIVGAKSETTINEIELRALNLENENKFLISYIDNNQLMYAKLDPKEQNLSADNFTYYTSAISHCFCFDSHNDNPNILLYKTTPNKKLYLSKFLSNEQDIFIDENVDIVYASVCPESSESMNIITYIKNGRCFYKTMQNFNFSQEKELPLPLGTYKDIRIICNNNSETIYIVASHENGSNYILHSLVEVSTGKISEFLYASYSMIVNKYVDLSFFNKQSIENLNITVDMIVKTFSYANTLIENLSKENLKISLDLNAETYKPMPETTYGVQLDKAILTGTEWGTYTDDCLSFSPAYMDFSNDNFIDNGWLERWPFNQIRPCLLQDGKIIGYLNPNDYTQLEDGSFPNLTSVDSPYAMIEIPKIYYSITRDDNYINVKISNKAKAGFVCSAHTYKGEEVDKIYVSAYLCGIDYYDLYGYKTKTNDNLAQYQALGYNSSRYNLLKEKDGERFEFLPYNVVKLIQCLYIIMFKNTNSQASLGTGYNSEKTSHVVGKLDKKGMYYGTNDYSLGVKFLGLEDIYGARKQLSTGFYIDSNVIPRFIDVNSPQMNYHPDYVDSYLASELPFIKGHRLARVAIDINEDGNNIGFFAKSNSTTRTLGFCDTTAAINSLSSSVDFGCSGTETANGIFSQSTVAVGNNSNARSARLVYYP